MAKLSARGRTELARVSKEWHFCHKHYTTVGIPYEWGQAPVYCKREANHEGDCAGYGLVIWERKTKALMSDKRVLSKLDCDFGPTGYGNEHQKHSYGWKQSNKLRDNVSVDQWVQFHLERGYKQC